MKKQWISVKCGLSRDPKHRQSMGESIWLFLHILDIASWEDGIVHDWKDEAEAEEMGMPVRTLRDHRRRLDELGYIDCKQKQYAQDIVIHNWTNPREYSGKVYNKIQSDMESEASKVQGDIQGYTQGSTKDVTPTLDSNNQITKPDMLDMLLDQERQTQPIRDACIAFETAFLGGSVSGWPWDSKPIWRKFAKWCAEQDVRQFTEYVEWRKKDGKYHAMSNNKIRQDPQMFMDTGWPTFLAHISMYADSEPLRML
jgi:hypothetical protein